MMLSIVIPVYNSGKTLERTLKSAIQEKTPDIELIVADGASTDDTPNILEKYRQYIDVLISEKDRGYADALNKGFNKASGEYLMMLAADDVLVPHAIEKALATIKEDTEVWCGSVINSETYGYRIKHSDPDLEGLRLGCTVRILATFLKKTAFEKYGPFDIEYKCATDRELLLRYYLKGAKFQFEKIPIVVFSSGGMSTADTTKYAIAEDKIISRKYGTPEELIEQTAEKLTKAEGRRKYINAVRYVLNKIGLLHPMYAMIGKPDECLTKKQLKEYGIDKL